MYLLVYKVQDVVSTATPQIYNGLLSHEFTYDIGSIDKDGRKAEEQVQAASSRDGDVSLSLAIGIVLALKIKTRDYFPSSIHAVIPCTSNDLARA